MKLFRIYQVIILIIYIILVSLFLYLSMQSGTKSGGLSSSISEILCKIFNLKDNNKVEHFVRKLIGHFMYFMAMGVFSTLFIYSLKINTYMAIGINIFINLLVAIISEFVCQVIASNRGPSIIDVLIDFSGFLLSAIIISLIYILRKKLYINKSIK